MAKIYSVNKEFNGISAGVNFVNGVGEAAVPYLISWFYENGYMVIEKMSYKELIEYAKGKGFNAIGMKKDELAHRLKEMEE